MNEWKSAVAYGIPAVCFTNLDDYKGEEWPTSFPAVPSVGQRVAARSGKTLTIHGITWTTNKDDRGCALRVELHRWATTPST